MTIPSKDDVAIALSIIAIIIAITPYFLSILRRCFAKIEISLGQFVEIGVTANGPVLGLQITLLAKIGEQFIENIEAEIKMVNGSSSHRLNWFILREGDLDRFTLDYISSKIASPFKIVHKGYRTLNLIFDDRPTKDVMIADLLSVEKKWVKDCVDHVKIRELINLDKQAEAFAIFRDENKPLIDKGLASFISSSYWNPGEFTLVLTVTTKNPSNKFKKIVTFKLNEDDLDLLTKNKETALAAVVNLSGYKWHWAHTKLDSKSI